METKDADNRHETKSKQGNVDVIVSVGPFEGMVLGQKYLVGRFLDRGENGEVHKVKMRKSNVNDKECVS